MMAALFSGRRGKADAAPSATITVENAGAARLAELEAGRNASTNRRKVAVLGAVAAVALFVAMLLPEGMLADYSALSGPGEFFERIAANVGHLAAVFAGSRTAGNYGIVVCRYAAAFAMGAMLGSCGAIYQGAFRNPLASPSTIGVVSGCLLGSVFFYMVLYEGWVEAALASVSTLSDLLQGLNPLEYVWVVYGRAICAVLGGFAVIGTALFVAHVMGGRTMTGVVLVVVGQVFTLTADSLVDTLRYYLETTGQIMRSTLVQLSEVAPFSTIVTFTDLAVVAVPLVACLVVMLLLRNRLNVLAFTDEEAQALGVDVARFRVLVVLLCTAATGIGVGFCGPVGFVGFVAPHVARRIVSADFRYLLPASMLVGAVFLVVAMQATMQTAIGADQGVNLVTTSLGCVAFLVVAVRSKGGSRAWV